MIACPSLFGLWDCPTLCRNTIPGDKSAMNPNGLRVGTPAMTSRGLTEDDFVKIGEFIGSAVDVAAEVQKESGPKLVDFKRLLKEKPPGVALKAISRRHLYMVQVCRPHPPPPPQRVWVHRFLYVGGTSGLPPAPPCGLGGRVCMYMHVWMYVCICM